jgi:thiamine biosynthesis lipoprotein
MGTWVAIEAAASTEDTARAGIEAAYLAIQQVELKLHPSRWGSDLGRLRAAPLGARVPIGAMAWEVLRLARTMYELSEAVFDPCLPSHPGRLCDLTLSEPGSGSAWMSCGVPLALDLGGIAKGYAIDCAVEALRTAGCTSGIVNAGGDLRVHGRSASVLLREANGHCTRLTLSDEALAVSDLAADTARRPVEHRGYYRRSASFTPVRGYAAVVAASAAIADALTKCALLARPRCARRALRAFRARQVR